MKRLPLLSTWDCMSGLAWSTLTLISMNSEVIVRKISSVSVRRVDFYSSIYCRRPLLLVDLHVFSTAIFTDQCCSHRYLISSNSLGFLTKPYVLRWKMYFEILSKDHSISDASLRTRRKPFHIVTCCLIFVLLTFCLNSECPPSNISKVPFWVIKK